MPCSLVMAAVSVRTVKVHIDNTTPTAGPSVIMAERPSLCRLLTATEATVGRKKANKAWLSLLK